MENGGQCDLQHLQIVYFRFHEELKLDLKGKMSENPSTAVAEMSEDSEVVESEEKSSDESASLAEQNEAADDPFAGHTFKVPAAQIKLIADMERWTKSTAYEDFMGCILTLNAAVKGKKMSSPCTVSPTVKGLMNLLDIFDKWIDDTPPIDQPQRFGNKAFRLWHEKLKKEAENLTAEILPVNLKRAAPEIVEYLHDAFGNPTRIDYGTGHEVAFASFLCCLFKIRVLGPDDKIATVLHVFNKYLGISRKLQQVYRMEPAGSQGVWGLDDYQFLPFIWGSSQFFSHPKLLPVNFVDPTIVNAYHDEYMFMECIKYILTVKTGPFAEHSNTLWGISGVAHWGKVNSGLVKMYKAEILQKFPIMQHFKFGSILTLEPTSRKFGSLVPKA